MVFLLNADHTFFNSVCFFFLSFYVGCWFFREMTERKRDHCFILFIYLCLYGMTFFFFQGVPTCLTAAIEVQEGHRVFFAAINPGGKITSRHLKICSEFNKQTLKAPEQRNKQTSEGSQARHSGALKA